nr:helix-turn-helix domain-containing protein [Prevotella sp.]
MKILKRILLILSFAIPMNGYSQKQYTYFNNLNLNGASTVCSVIQDKSGFIWIGTENGLYSYDGYHCFSHNDVKGLCNGRIHSIVVYGDNIFLGTENGLFCYVINTGEYHKIASCHLRDIRAIVRDGDRLLLGGASGLYEYLLKTNQCHFISLHNNPIYSLLHAPSGIIIGTLNGLFIVNKRGKSKQIILNKGSQPLVNALTYDSSRHCFWIGAEGSLIRTDFKTFTPLPSLKGNSVKSLVTDRYGNLLIGTDNGLFVYDKRNNVRQIIHDAVRSNSLTNNIVWSLFRDNNRNIWAGTDNGLSFSEGLRCFDYTSVADITGSVDGNCLHAIYRDNNGTMWIGGTNGLIKYNDSFLGYNNITWYRQNSKINNLSHNRVRKIYQDRDGDIWVATDHGINYYNRQSGHFRNFIVRDKTGRYNSSWAYDILLDKKNRLWIAAYMGGIFIIDKHKLISSDGEIIADSHISIGKNGLKGIHVGQMAVDKRGNIWAMLYGKGLDYINSSTLHVSHILGNKSLGYITTDERGNLWAGYDGGVIELPSPNKRPIYHSFSDGITPTHVTTMTAAGGRLWIFCDNVCRVISKDNHIIHFRLSQVSAITSFYSKKKDNIYIGGNDGLESINPSVIKKIQNTRYPSLVSMLVNGEEYKGKDGNILFKKNISLKSDENNLTFRFSDLPFDNFPQALYVYKLEGSDRNWRYLNDFKGEITYNGLRHGKYKMIVRNIDDTNNQYVFSLDITILAPWYLTIWAYIIYIALILLLIWWVMNFYAVKRSLSLERTARQRIMEQSQARAHFFAKLSDNLKKPLAHILAPVSKLLADGDDKAAMKEIWKGAKEINRLIYLSLDTDGENMENSKAPLLETINIVDYLRLEVVNHERDSHSSSMRLETNIAKLYIDVDIVRFDIIVNEIINFMKCHTAGDAETVITIDADMDKKIVAIRITNNNFHITDSEQNMIFQRYPLSDNNANNQQTGLFVVRKYVESSHGTIHLDVSPVSGNLSFLLNFPIDEKTIVEAEDEQNREDKLFIEITDIIEAHISDTEFSVACLQTELGIGGKLLYRKIKTISGMTPVEYIRNIRMKKAALLLREGKYSISEVMFLVGFSNSGYFSKCFQRSFGVIPTVYVESN